MCDVRYLSAVCGGRAAAQFPRWADHTRVPLTKIRALLPSNGLTAFLIAGAVTGLLGVALFGAAHAATIVPIWTSLSGGIPFAVGAGLAIGWAVYELRGPARFNVGVIRALAFSRC